jgi:Txe/YoeB family toxin of Txe-Axe toxin-antitoxin module
MIYIFYTALSLAAVVSIGVIYELRYELRRIEKLHKHSVKRSAALQVQVLDQNSKIRQLEDTQQTWARIAGDLNQELTDARFTHIQEVEQLKTDVWNAGEFGRRVREQKRRHMAKKRKEAKSASIK